MKINYDSFKNFNRFNENIEISLARPNKQIIGRLTEAFNIKQQLKLGQLNEITFSIPYQVERQFVLKENKHVDQIKQRYLLKITSLNKDEWYIIFQENDSLNDSNIKEVTAYSLGYQLADKYMRDWPGVKIDGEYRKDSLTASQILNDLLIDSSWSLDLFSTDTIFLSRYRAFDFSNTTILDAIFTVAEKFNAIISWDTQNKKITLHDAEKYGVFRGLMLSDNQYLKSYEKVTKSDEMATRLKLYGFDGLSINEVNPTGTEFIEDFSFFMRGFEMDANKNVLSSSPYMSDELCIAIIDYQKVIETNSSEFTFYLTQKEGLEAQYTLRESELSILENDLFTIQKSIDYKESLKLDAGAEKSQELNKKAEIEVKKNQLSELLISIENINAQILELRNLLSMRANFNQAQIMELDNYIIEKTWTNENISDAKELLELGIKELEKLNKPSVIYNISLVYLLEIAEAERLVTKLRLGDKIRIVKKELNEIVESQVIEIQIDHESQDINLTITDSIITNDEDALVSMLYKSMSSSAVIELNKNKWNDISRVGNLIGDVLESKWDSTKREIVAGANESVIINNRGITAMDSDDPDKYIRITHGAIGMTDNGGKDFNLAIDASGVYAQRLVGRIIAGEHLYMENTEGTFRFDQDGVTIQGNALRVLAADNSNLIEKWNAAEANANAYADSMKLQIQQDIKEIQLAIGDFNVEVLDAFADGIISEAESISIGNYKNTLNTEKADIELRFQSIYDNVQLTGNPKEVLDIKKTAYDSAHTNLLETIDIAIEDKKTTLEEKRDVDNMFALYRTTLSELSVAFEDAINAIAQAKATLAKENALEASVQLGQTINGVTMDERGLTVTRGDDRVEARFNATEGILIRTKKGSTWTDAFKYDLDNERLIVDGEINARDLKINDEPVLTNDGKISVGAIENLIIGSNITMGPGAVISWSNLDNSARDAIAANQMNWLGSLSVYPIPATKNDAFYHIVDGKSYIYNGSTWTVLAQDGQTGTDGINAITAVLSNDSHVLNANKSGVVSSFAGCTTTAYVYQGSTDMSSLWSATVTATNLTYTTSGKTYTVTGISADTGYLDITLTRSGYASIVKRFTVTKAKQGEDGLSGENSISYWLINSTPAIAKSNLGVYTPSTITITGKTQTGADSPANYAGRFIISTSTNGTTYTTKYLSSSDESSVVYNPEVNIKTIRVQMYLAGGITTLVDEQIIPIISDGIDGEPGTSAITAVLSNDSHVLNADSNGNVTSFAGCNTTVYVYEGIVDVSSSWTATVVTTNLTYTTSGKTYTVTGISADTGYLDITLTRSGYSSIVKRFTVTKAKQGSQGINATSYWLVNSVPAIAKSTSGTYTPSTITVTGKAQTGTNSPTNYSCRFDISTSTDGTTYTTQYTSTSNETSTTYSVNISNIKTIRVRMYLAGGTSTLLDEQIIPIVSDGQTGPQGVPGSYYAPWYLNANHIGETEIQSPKLTGNTLIGSSGLVGMTSEGVATDSVRFWAGSSFDDRHNAPFRVLQDGSVALTKASIETVSTGGKYITISQDSIRSISNGRQVFALSTDQFGNFAKVELTQHYSYTTTTSTSTVNSQFLRIRYDDATVTNIGNGFAVNGADNSTRPGAGKIALYDHSQSSDYRTADVFITSNSVFPSFFKNQLVVNKTSTSTKYALEVYGRIGLSGELVSENPSYGFTGKSITLQPLATTMAQAFGRIEGFLCYDSSSKKLVFYNGTNWEVVYSY